MLDNSESPNYGPMKMFNSIHHFVNLIICGYIIVTYVIMQCPQAMHNINSKMNLPQLQKSLLP